MTLAKSTGRRAALLLGLVLSLAAPVAAADSNAGAYLAARQATFANDFATAARYYSEALVLDPRNTDLLEGATSAHVALGQIDRALPLARRLAEHFKLRHLDTGLTYRAVAERMLAANADLGDEDAAVAAAEALDLLDHALQLADLLAAEAERVMSTIEQDATRRIHDRVAG